MSRDDAVLALARQVPPLALCAYARELGWLPVSHHKNDIAIFHRPDTPLHQVIVPLDEGFTDYGEMVSTAVERLARYEKKPQTEVLDHLLLPPSDLLQFRDTGPEAEDGTLPLTQIVE